MRTIRLYTTQKLVPGSETELDAKPAHHAVTVLRLKPKDFVTLFNGDGHDYPAKIVSISKKTAVVQVLEQTKNQTESALKVHLAQVISRGDKMDFSLQKAVELGVSSITPLFSERCGVQLKGDRLAKKQAHWQEVVISACEQSGRAVVPEVQVAQNLSDWLSTSAPDLSGTKLMLHPWAVNKDQCFDIDTMKHNKPGNNNFSLLVGPEGGFSEAEVSAALAQGFLSWQLGPRVLRTETAGLAALAVLQALFGDF